MRKIIVFLIILGAGIAIGVYYSKQSKTEKIENQVQTDAEKAREAMRAGVDKVEAVVSEAKEGAQKAGEMATNVAAHVKAGAQKASAAVTNAVGEIKNKLD